VTNLTTYEIAWLVAGAERVAQVALVALASDGRLAVAYKRQRVKVQRLEAADPIEAAALELVPESGLSVSALVNRLAASAAVLQLESAVRGKGVRRRGLLRPSRTYRELVRDPGSGLRRVAVLGTPGIEDERLREVFEHPRPEMPDFNQQRSRTYNTIDGTIGPNLDARSDPPHVP
jgi:uncharacterized protein (TIGR04222 family)